MTNFTRTEVLLDAFFPFVEKWSGKTVSVWSILIQSGYFKMIPDLLKRKWISNQWKKKKDFCKVLNLNSNILLTLSRFCVPYSVQWLLFDNLLHYVPLENISLNIIMEASSLLANGCKIEAYARHILCLSRAGGISVVHHLLWQRTSVLAVSFDGSPQFNSLLRQTTGTEDLLW